MAKPVHLGTTCADCHMRDIIGLCYKCGHCVDYTLCAMCFPYKSHPIDHLFLILERPLLMQHTLLVTPPFATHNNSPSPIFAFDIANTDMCMDVQPTPSFALFTLSK